MASFEVGRRQVILEGNQRTAIGLGNKFDAGDGRQHPVRRDADHGPSSESGRLCRWGLRLAGQGKRNTDYGATQVLVSVMQDIDDVLRERERHGP